MNVVELRVTKTSLELRGDGVQENVPYDDLPGLGTAVSTLMSRIAEPSASRMSVLSEQFGVVVLDASGTTLAPILWADDTRSHDDAAWCNKKFSSEWWIERTGTVPETRHGITKLSWLHRSEPAVWERIAHICGVDDFVRWTCLASPVADLVISQATMDAMGWGKATRADVDVLALIDKERDWAGVIPRVVEDGSVLGTRNGVAISV